MALAQVLPSSRKQEHLEAGKRRLEEFRKKKAADRAKKAAATNQPSTTDVRLNNKQPLETESVRPTDFDGAGTSDLSSSTIEPIDVISSRNDNHASSSTSSRVDQGLFSEAVDANPIRTSDYKTTLADAAHSQVGNHDFRRYSDDYSESTAKADANYGLQNNETNDGYKTFARNHVGGLFGLSSDNSIIPHPQENVFNSSSSQSIPFQSTEDSTLSKNSFFGSSYGSSFQSPANNYTANEMTNSVGFIQPNSKLGGSDPEVKQDMSGSMHFNGSLKSDFADSNVRSLSGYPSSSGKITQTSESIGFGSDGKTSLFSGLSESNSRKSRPSFLDSVIAPRASSGTSFQPTKLQKDSLMPTTSKSDGMGALGLSAFQKPLMGTQTVGQPMTVSAPENNGFDLKMSNVDGNRLEREHGFYSSKQNDDFAALEQHIEDLTQEKFSLQRALEASRALAESLASENSSLTDNYNQQRISVNHLKSDMEKLQEEIKIHLVELEAVKMEYGNAKLECNAADERAKILASEVISLEEKALRLRSNELKLERQLENTNAEIASYKKKMSSPERERQDLQSTIDALKEEKKLLQTKLRKASASGKSIDFDQSGGKKKDSSTSTDDLDGNLEPSNQEALIAASLSRSDTPGHHILPENEQLNLDTSTVYIPSDQLRMIDNINTLLSELALEKDELVQSLASESSQCSKLKELNNELSRKLEAQTQRLELLTAQRMANDNIQVRLPDSQIMQESATTYADEGDEVVERVLGWIMKLFPGGPSKRRTSKLL